MPLIFTIHPSEKSKITSLAELTGSSIVFFILTCVLINVPIYLHTCLYTDLSVWPSLLRKELCFVLLLPRT